MTYDVLPSDKSVVVFLPLIAHSQQSDSSRMTVTSSSGQRILQPINRRPMVS